MRPIRGRHEAVAVIWGRVFNWMGKTGSMADTKNRDHDPSILGLLDLAYSFSLIELKLSWSSEIWEDMILTERQPD